MEDLLRKKEALLQGIIDCSDYLRGSITSVCSTCNRANCICVGKPRGRAYRLTYKNKQQKTRTVYLSSERLPEVKKKISNYKRIRGLMEKLFEINIAILKKKSKL